MSSELWLAQAVHCASTLTLILVPEPAHSQLTGGICMALDGGVCLTLLCAIRVMFSWTGGGWYKYVLSLWAVRKAFEPVMTYFLRISFYLWDNLKKPTTLKPTKHKTPKPKQKTQAFFAQTSKQRTVLWAYSCHVPDFYLGGTLYSFFPWSLKDVLGGQSFSQCIRSSSSLDRGSPVATWTGTLLSCSVTCSSYKHFFSCLRPEQLS